MYVCMYIYMHVRMYVCMYVRMYVCIYTYVCMYVYIYTCIDPKARGPAGEPVVRGLSGWCSVLAAASARRSHY